MFKSNEFMMTLNAFRKLDMLDPLDDNRYTWGYYLGTNFSFYTSRQINNKEVEIFRYNFKITQELFNEIIAYEKLSKGAEAYVVDMDDDVKALIMYKKDYYNKIILPRKHLLEKLLQNHNKIFNIGKDYYKINKGIILTEWNPKTNKKKTTKKSKIIQVADLQPNEAKMYINAIDKVM